MEMEKKKILIIDDDEDFLEGTKIALEANNFKVYTAISGEDGLKKLKEDKPHLIILDIMMPKKSGFQVCKELKKDVEYNKIPVIILTALSQKIGETNIALSEGFELEAEDYIDKPVEIKELIKRINELLK
jgi:two-component system alkaline phosphatase synthesis response regulator PhoP